jgi:predicted Zn-dependent peptidase
MLKTFKLKNGLQVATYDLPNLRSLHLSLIAKGGSLVEKKSQSGVGHFLEHMLVQGIPSYPNVESFAGFIEGLAGTYGAHTQKLLIGFEIIVPSAYLEDAVKISSEVFFEPLFMTEPLERERGVIMEEIRQRMDSKNYKLSKFFNETRFGLFHPFVQEVPGTVETVGKLSKSDLVKQWQKYFVAKNTYLTVVGNFKELFLKAQLEKYFGQYPAKEEFSGYPKMGKSDFSPRQVAIRCDQTLQTDYIDLSFPSLPAESPLELRLKQTLAVTILGRLRNSRLFKLLRYKRGLVYDVSAGARLLPGLGFINISSEVSPEHLEEVVSLISQALETFVTNGPTAEELEFAKNFLNNRWQMSFDHPSSIANWIEDELLWEEKIHLPEELAKSFQKVTPSDLVELMQKYWDFSKLNLVIQGPIAKSKTNEQKFARLVENLK